MQYLTTDVMDVLTEFKKINVRFDMLWQGNTCLIRIHNINIFNPPSILSEPFGKGALSSLKKSYNIFELIMKLNAAITKSIKEAKI